MDWTSYCAKINKEGTICNLRVKMITEGMKFNHCIQIIKKFTPDTC